MEVKLFNPKDKQKEMKLFKKMLKLDKVKHADKIAKLKQTIKKDRKAYKLKMKEHIKSRPKSKHKKPKDTGLLDEGSFSNPKNIKDTKKNSKNKKKGGNKWA